MLWSAPLFAQAQSVQDQIITQLQDQGFDQIQISRTLLGRIQLRALSPTLDREMIFNPATGEILRDSWTRRSSGSTVPRVANPSRGNNNNDRPRNDGRIAGDDDDDDNRSSSGGRRADRDDDDDDKGRGRGRGRGRGGNDDDDDDD